MSEIRCMAIFGTRPEAIKMAPVVQALQGDERFRVKVVVTAQHREMLDQALEIFGIKPDYDLNLMRPGQALGDVVSGVLKGLTPILEADRPDVVLVHGDTITTFAAALAAFFCKIPVAHVEAGLRTDDRYDPFPEEMDRRLTGVLATLHFAPTPWAKSNLLAENVPPEAIYVTGNTAIDALLGALQNGYRFEEPRLQEAVDSGRRLILMTAHRRENWGEPIRRIYQAVLEIVQRHPDVAVVFPVHKNPVVREPAFAMLGGHERIVLVEPVGYLDMIHMIRAATLVLTDSGGLQEEAPSLGKPVLVLRETTERPEGVAAGTCLKVGTDPARIVAEASRLLTDRKAYSAMAQAVNPYGDGRAALRIKEALLHWLGLAARPADYAGSPAATGVAKA